MIVKAINDDTLVVYQIADEDNMPNEALIIQRDAGGSIVITQEARELVINPTRANVKQICAAMQRAIELCEAAEEKQRI